MTQTPAAWYPDPEQPGMQRYWDGTQWTDHRAPLGPSTSDQLTRAGHDVAEGISTAFTAAGNWLSKQAAPAQQSAQAGAPTFASIAAGCRDDALREPLSQVVEAVVGPDAIDPVRRVFAEAGVPITAAEAETAQPVRLVPNPWNAADAGAVAVLVRQHQVAMLPAEDAAAYGPTLVRLSQAQRLATGTATLRATWTGQAVTATVTLRLPEVAALD